MPPNVAPAAGAVSAAVGAVESGQLVSVPARAALAASRIAGSDDFGGVVGVVRPRLPRGERRLVGDVEDHHPDHVRLAGRDLERLAVVRGLGRLVDNVARGRLGARVDARPRGRDRGLDAELAVEDRQGRAALRGAVEGLAEERDELAVVRHRDRGRARMGEARREGRVVLVDVHVEDVHQRRGAAARAVDGAEIPDERGGGVRRLRGRVDVAAAGRQRAADHPCIRPDGLDRVVAPREQVLVGGGRGVGRVGVELRRPERVRRSARCRR